MMRDARSSSAPPYAAPYQPPSPRGSPAPRTCCYSERRRNGSFLCCCYVCPRRSSASALATAAVCCLVLGYTVLGAFVFMALEGGLGPSAAPSSSAGGGGLQRAAGLAGELRAQTVDRLWSITENLNILYRENWTRLAAEEVLAYQEALFRALRVADGRLLHRQPPHRWTFSSSLLYSLTLITTIGYGSVSPRTSWGKLATIIYALVGIPLMLLYLSTTGDVLARSFRRLYGRLCGGGGGGGGGQKQPQCACDARVKVPAALCLLIVLLYICSGALLFHRLEDWSLLEGSYFCFTSLGTIGFGDLLPGRRAEDVSLCACAAYIVAGMALVAMCVSLAQEEVLHALRWLGAACKGS